jgi:hypothetical protein
MRFVGFLFCVGIVLFCSPNRGSAQEGVDPELISMIVKETIRELAAQGMLKNSTAAPSSVASPTVSNDAGSKNPVEVEPSSTYPPAKGIITLPADAVVFPEDKDDGLYFSAEAAILKARMNMGGFQNTDSVRGSSDPAGANVSIRRPDFDYKTTARFTVGYENNGKGFRMRAMQFSDSAVTSVFDADTSNGELPGRNSVSQSVDIDSYDFELTKKGSASGWDILGSAGVRYAEVGNDLLNFDHADFARNNEVDRLRDQSRGVGVTGGLEGRYDFDGLPLTAVVKGRASVLPMDVARSTSTVRSNPVTGAFVAGNSTLQNGTQTVTVLEGFIGLESSFDTAGGLFIINLGVESQRWLNAAILAGSDENDISLNGFIFGVAVDF